MNERLWNVIRPMLPPMFVSGEGAVEKPLSSVADASATASSVWHPGDWAIYRKSKRSNRPGPRAAGVKATVKGETYAYVVDKFWVVDEVLSNGQLVMRTTRGKFHQVWADDPNLLRPGWFARLRWGQRFRAIEQRFGQSTVAA